MLSSHIAVTLMVGCFIAAAILSGLAMDLGRVVIMLLVACVSLLSLGLSALFLSYPSDKEKHAITPTPSSASKEPKKASTEASEVTLSTKRPKAVLSAIHAQKDAEGLVSDLKMSDLKTTTTQPQVSP